MILPSSQRKHSRPLRLYKPTMLDVPSIDLCDWYRAVVNIWVGLCRSLTADRRFLLFGPVIIWLGVADAKLTESVPNQRFCKDRVVNDW